MCGKNQVFARQKRQSVHNEGNNALSSRRRNAISCDPSVGDKVELYLVARSDSNISLVTFALIYHICLKKSFSVNEFYITGYFLLIKSVNFKPYASK